MKHLAAFVAVVFAVTSLIFGQGSLTPPGSPAPTMKTLEQVEPRTPITNLPVTISQPGSYYVTTNLTGSPSGITIAADGVTLDLMGFELVGGGGGAGVSVSGVRTNIAIRNGRLRNWSWGVLAQSAFSGIFEHLQANANGFSGILVGSNSIIRSCIARSNVAGIGIFAGQGSTVKDCVAQGSSIGSGKGIWVGEGSTVSGCAVQSNGTGIQAEPGSTIKDCTALGSTFYGIQLAHGCTVANSTVAGSGSDGILAASGCTIQDCTVVSNGNYGVNSTGAGTIRGCTARSNTAGGINAGSGSLVKDCQAADNNGDGIVANGSAISGCVAKGNVGDGIEVNSNCLVADNTCEGNGAGAGNGAAIHVTGGANRIDNNQSTASDRGIDVDGTLNLIIRNSCSSNTTNYDIAANNYLAPTLIPPLSGALIGDSGGSGTFTNHPWANFSY